MRQHEPLRCYRGSGICERDICSDFGIQPILRNGPSPDGIRPYPRTNGALLQIDLPFNRDQSANRGYDTADSYEDKGNRGPSRRSCIEERPPLYIASALFFGVGLGSLFLAILMAFCVNYKRPFLAASLIGIPALVAACAPLWWFYYCLFFPYTWGLPPSWLPDKWNPCKQENGSQHGETVSQKVLTPLKFEFQQRPCFIPDTERPDPYEFKDVRVGRLLAPLGLAKTGLVGNRAIDEESESWCCFKWKLQADTESAGLPVRNSLIDSFRDRLLKHLTILRELSVAVRKLQAVALRDPVMPVADGFLG